MWIKFSNPPKNCNNEPISKFFGVLERSEFALSVQNKCFVYRNPKLFQNTKFVEISCYGSDILVFFMIFRPLNIQNGPSGDRDISSSAQNKSPALPKRFWWDSATVFLVQGAITFKIPLISWNHHFRANGSCRNTCNKNFAHIARRIEKLKFTNLLTNRKSVQKRKSSGLKTVHR